jgi:uncharacterized protein YdaU (DUF1376 family)
MGKAPAFQFYADDWLGSTKIALMSPAEEGAYIRLLAHAWNSDDCAIPDDDGALSILSRLGGAWAGSSEVIRSCFRASKNGRLINDRLLEERKKQLKHQKAMSNAGKAGAAKRWPSHGQANAEAMAKNSSSSSSSSSLSSSEEKRGGAATDEWERRMLQICDTRGVPNRPETCRKWIRAMAGKLGRQRAGDILEFDASVAHSPITDTYDRFCNGSDAKAADFAAKRDANGPPKL